MYELLSHCVWSCASASGSCFEGETLKSGVYWIIISIFKKRALHCFVISWKMGDVM